MSEGAIPGASAWRYHGGISKPARTSLPARAGFALPVALASVIIRTNLILYELRWQALTAWTVVQLLMDVSITVKAKQRAAVWAAHNNPCSLVDSPWRLPDRLAAAIAVGRQGAIRPCRRQVRLHAAAALHSGTYLLHQEYDVQRLEPCCACLTERRPHGSSVMYDLLRPRSLL